MMVAEVVDVKATPIRQTEKALRAALDDFYKTDRFTDKAYMSCIATDKIPGLTFERFNGRKEYYLVANSYQERRELEEKLDSLGFIIETDYAHGTTHMNIKLIE